MTRIFISYRRDESRGMAGRMSDHLVRRFARRDIFMDVDDMKPGIDFVEQLETQLSQCDVLLAVIGPQWLDARDEKNLRKLAKADDYLRIEIASALKRNIPVIPVLLDGAIMPSEDDLTDDLKPLARRHAMELRHTSFNSDIEAIVRGLKGTLPRKSRTRLLLATAGGIVVAYLAGPAAFRPASVPQPSSSAVEDGEATLKPNDARENIIPPALGNAGGTTEPAAEKSAGLESQQLASAPPHSPDSAPEYEDRGRTFFVSSTRLEWTKNPTKEMVEWEVAKSYCESLPLAGGKWRVPTYKELWGLLSDRVAGDRPSFSVPGLDSDTYWTSTPGKPYALSDGELKPSMKTLDFTWQKEGTAQYMFTHYTWCVRP